MTDQRFHLRPRLGTQTASGPNCGGGGRGRRLLALTATGCLLLLLGLAALATMGRRGPVLALDATEYDFGSVRPQALLEHRFRLTNRGSSPLVIRGVKECCGLSTWLEGDPSISPGESRSISVRTLSPFTPGPDTRVFHIDTNDPRQPQIPLRVSWSVARVLVAVPGVVDAGDIHRGQTITRTVDLVNVPRDFRVLDVQATPSALRAEPKSTPQGGAYRRIDIALSTTKLSPGSFFGQVLVETNDPVDRRIAIPVRATILDDCEVRPPRLSLGLIGTRSHPVARATILIRGHPAPPVRLQRHMGLYRVTLSPQRGGRAYLLAVRPASRLSPGRIADMVELRVGPRIVRVPISGYVDPALD